MTAANYTPTTSFIKGEEGDYSDVLADSGNYVSGIAYDGAFIGSRWGCGAPATFVYLKANLPSVVLTAAYMKALPDPVYDGMARDSYWTPLQCDALPAGLELSCMDDGWNTGIGSAARKLQAVLGATQDGVIGSVTLGLIESVALAPIAQKLGPLDAALLQKRLGVTADGSIGPVTLAALAAQPDQRMPLLLIALYEKQVAYYRSLSNFPTFGVGWLARASRRLTAALALADVASSISEPRAAGNELDTSLL